MDEVKNLSEYLAQISQIKNNKHHGVPVSSFTFFRGQADLDWEITPSLYRLGLFDSERLMLTELQHVCPNEFVGNRFDILTKMQHYGMPTRLLDTTTNPLVALYFACKDNSEKDGAVFIFPNLPVSWSNDPLIDLIMDYIFDFGPYFNLQHFLAHSKEKYGYVYQRHMPQDAHEMLRYLNLGALAVMPAKTNPRILAQDGAFFLFGMKLNFDKITQSGEYYKCSPADLKNPSQIWNYNTKIKIPSDCKKGMIEELDVLGINENRLFPDLSNQINYIVNRVKENI